jgi:hypothetical protein
MTDAVYYLALGDLTVPLAVPENEDAGERIETLGPAGSLFGELERHVVLGEGEAILISDVAEGFTHPLLMAVTLAEAEEAQASLAAESARGENEPRQVPPMFVNFPPPVPHPVGGGN